MLSAVANITKKQNVDVAKNFKILKIFVLFYKFNGGVFYKYVTTKEVQGKVCNSGYAVSVFCVKRYGVSGTVFWSDEVQVEATAVVDYKIATFALLYFVVSNHLRRIRQSIFPARCNLKVERNVVSSKMPHVNQNDSFWTSALVITLQHVSNDDVDYFCVFAGKPARRTGSRRRYSGQKQYKQLWQPQWCRMGGNSGSWREGVRKT